MYILPRLLRETASAIRRRAWPSTESGSDGLALTPTTTPWSLPLMLVIALCACGFWTSPPLDL
uniref:Uncharacterized protein n=1 Tax=Arundo donax TaxID=35708 RepID=A0A0A9F685_ARUDO